MSVVRMLSWVVAMMSIGLGGCANVALVQGSPARMATVQGQDLSTVTYKRPDFTAMTAGKAAFAMLGAVAMISEGNKLIAENNVPDPALSIAQTLAPAVAAKTMGTPSRSFAEVETGVEAEKAVADAAGGRGLVLDVKTINWMFVYFPSNWSRYRVQYVARARLINGATGELIAQVPCTFVSDDEKTAPTYDELVGNGAALLKTKLEAAGKACSEVIEKNLFAS